MTDKFFDMLYNLGGNLPVFFLFCSDFERKHPRDVSLHFFALEEGHNVQPIMWLSCLKISGNFTVSLSQFGKSPIFDKCFVVHNPQKLHLQAFL